MTLRRGGPGYRPPDRHRTGPACGTGRPVLYRLWQSDVFSDDTWGGSFAILTPTISPPSEGTYRLFLEDRRERPVVVWGLSENAVGEFIGLDVGVPEPAHEILVTERT